MIVFFLIFLAILYAVQYTVTSRKIRLVLTTLILIVLVITASASYFSFDSYKGWPVSQPVNEGNLIAYHIVPPKGEFPGVIYAWVKVQPPPTPWYELFAFQPDAKSLPPRAFAFAYTNESADKFQQAGKLLQEGYTVSLNSETEDPLNNLNGALYSEIYADAPTLTLIEPTFVPKD